MEGLPADLPAAIVVVQHRSKESESLLASLLQDHSRLPVSEVEDKDPIASGRVYIAPPDYHLLVDGPTFSLSVDAPVKYSRPSIDVTFFSAADTYRARAVGVVLTGANDDGSRGLRRIVDRGGRAVVQRPDTAEVATMPAAALRMVPEATVLALAEIGAHVAQVARALATAPGARSGGPA
jgi:two-component system, chemotaxis family, protein-glutamate methylesterase/glutaminase